MGFYFERLHFSGYPPWCGNAPDTLRVKHHTTFRRTVNGSHPFFSTHTTQRQRR